MDFFRISLKTLVIVSLICSFFSCQVEQDINPLDGNIFEKSSTTSRKKQVQKDSNYESYR
jgi:hypothetical protein